MIKQNLNFTRVFDGNHAHQWMEAQFLITQQCRVVSDEQITDEYRLQLLLDQAGLILHRDLTLHYFLRFYVDTGDFNSSDLSTPGLLYHPRPKYLLDGFYPWFFTLGGFPLLPAEDIAGDPHRLLCLHTLHRLTVCTELTLLCLGLPIYSGAYYLPLVAVVDTTPAGLYKEIN